MAGHALPARPSGNNQSQGCADRPTAGPVERSHALGEQARALIGSAETFFIATANPESGATGGLDVSHRGGRPGFVQVADETTLLFPDFSGNNHFNTFGNLSVDPRAGLLFLDFETGDALYLSGRAEVIWEDDAVANFAGAERLVRFTLEEAVSAPGSLPIRFTEGAPSPFLDDTGAW